MRPETLDASDPGIKLLSDAADERSWSEFVESSPAATAYHSLAWRDLTVREYGFTPHYLLCEVRGEVRGVLPLFHVRNLTGRKLVSLPGAMYGGSVAVDDEHASRLLRSAARHCAAGRIRLQVPVAASLVDAEQAEPVEVDSRVPITGEPEEAALARLPSLTRRGLSKSRRAGVEIRFGRQELLDDLYRALVSTRRRLGLPLPRRRYYASLLDRLESGVVCAYVDGVAVAGCLYLMDRCHVHYAVPGSLPAARDVGAGDRIVWELLRLAGFEGRAELCLGGGPAWHEGLLRFKRRWGSVQSPVYRFPGSGPVASSRAIRRGGVRALRWLPPRLIGPASRLAIKHLY